jgi:hypothetical protein
MNGILRVRTGAPWKDISGRYFIEDFICALPKSKSRRDEIIIERIGPVTKKTPKE